MNTSLRLHRSLLILLLPLAAFPGLTGCTSVEVAPGQLAEFKLGELQVWVDRDFATVYNAAKAGAKDTSLFQTQDDKKVVEADLHFRDTLDSLVIIKVKEVATRRTSLKIRYGIMPQGNLAQTQKIYQAIQKHL